MRGLLRDLYIQCALMSDERLRETVHEIERFDPHVLVCYAQAGAELARYVNRNGLRSWESFRRASIYKSVISELRRYTFLLGSGKIRYSLTVVRGSDFTA